MTDQKTPRDRALELFGEMRHSTDEERKLIEEMYNKLSTPLKPWQSNIFDMFPDKDGNVKSAPLTAATDEALWDEDGFLRELPDRYGAEPQLSMLIEEMAELIQALEKHRRASSPIDIISAEEHIAEEMADVRIMLAQASGIFGNDEIVARYVKQKLDRQRLRIAAQDERENKSKENNADA